MYFVERLSLFGPMVPFVLEVFDLMKEIVLQAGMWSAVHGTSAPFPLHWYDVRV